MFKAEFVTLVSLKVPSGSLSLHLVILEEFVVDVLLLVQDGVIGLEVVLVQHLRLDDGRDVQEGVPHAQDDPAGDGILTHLQSQVQVQI